MDWEANMKALNDHQEKLAEILTAMCNPKVIQVASQSFVPSNS